MMPCEKCGHVNLTPREKQVLRAIWHGHTKKQAAVVLGVTYKTVRVHLDSIRRKLGVHSTLDALKEVVADL